MALLGLPALGGPAARAAEVGDAQCAPGSTFTGYGRDRIAQTFTAEHTGKLTRVTIFAHSPSPTNTDDWIIEIRKTTRKGKPGTAVLASQQVNDVVRPAPGQTTMVIAEFSPGARVEKGERYALVITGVGDVLPIVQSNEAPGCAGALYDDNDRDNKFIKDTNADIVFETVVTRP